MLMIEGVLQLGVCVKFRFESHHLFSFALPLSYFFSFSFILFSMSRLRGCVKCRRLDTNSYKQQQTMYLYHIALHNKTFVFLVLPCS
jgi:hypothetical protein